MYVLFPLFLSLLISCNKADHSQPGVQKSPTTSRDDSLFLADDYLELGFDQYSYENYDSGLVLFDLALKYNPELSQAWHGRALMLDNLQRDSEAVVAYKNAEKFDSTNRQAIWHLGCMFARAGEKEKALRQLRTVIALDSSYAIAVRTESCWTSLHNDVDFLEVTGYYEAEE
ncbi:MAG: hypothetical protein KDB65_01995 [Calditrichaeota bacterium]|nr:hypothetical protein [Calditrichota bacterium]